MVLLMNRKQRRAAAKTSGDLAAANMSAGQFAANSLSVLLTAGVRCHQSGRLLEAEAFYRQVLGVDPSNADAIHLSGMIAFQKRQTDEAIRLMRRAIELDRRNPLYHCDLGNVFQGLGRFQDAIQSYDRALSLRPSYPEAIYNKGNAFLKLKKFVEASACYRKVTEIEPRYVEAYTNLGIALEKLGLFEDALAACDKALQIKPDHAAALNNRAACADIVCDWPRKFAFTGNIAGQLEKRMPSISPLLVLSAFDDPSFHFKYFGQLATEMFEPLPAPLTAREAKWRSTKLKIAYLSADFREHPVSSLMAEILETHDRSQFETMGVSFGVDDGSALRKRLVKAFDRFEDVRTLNDESVARLIHEWKADIAIDLTGHTSDGRLGILLFRPAPIQVSYLGFSATTGAPFIDYIVADPIVTPFEHQPFYMEKIVQLPDCMLPRDNTVELAGPTPTRAEACLPETGFVFCGFNQNWKITPEIFDIWMRLLNRVEGSVLWLRRDNELAERNLSREAQARGVDPERLIFAPRTPTVAEHLSRQRLADLFLDTLPYNAHTTASDALYAGVPVVTCAGNAFAGRVAASLLHAIGLPELVTSSLEVYETLALRLATEPALLQDVRRRLQANRSTYPLFDSGLFRRNLEAAYRQMWEIWQRDEPPQSFRVGKP